MSATAEFLSKAATAFQHKQGDVLSQLVLPDLNDPDVELISEELLPEDVNIRIIVLKSLSNDNQTRLADLMGTVLQYVRDATLFDHDAHVALLRSLRISKIYESATKMFALPDSGWFNPCIQQLTIQLLERAVEADEAQDDNSRDRLVAAITMVTNGPVKTAAADNRESDALHVIAPRPRHIAFWLANLLLQNSFELRDTLASAEPILGFLGPQMDNLHFFTKAEQVTFHYYAGSVFLVKEELRPARDHLQLAFELCTNHSLKNKRLIVINLVTVSILLGIFPHPHLLAMFGLSDYFLPLIRAIKLGDRSAFRQHLDSNIEWFRERYIYLILRAKGEVLVIRSLFRRAIVLSRNLWPPEKIGQPPTIQFEQLLTAIRLSYRYSAIGDMDVSTWDQVDMEALCASLVDQGYIQGYLLHSRSCLVVQKGPTLGFPPVSSIAVRNEE
ncbi:hypothetical protein JB92DRAFT_3135155 [Gautieria morchelliformis]|nr:hypothetical protein JB92DRAFT_3135155 [Gautieria morchelliformis]